MNGATAEVASDPPLGYSPAVTATKIGLGRTSTYELIKSGRLRSVRVGRRIIVPRSAIEEFLAGASK